MASKYPAIHQQASPHVPQPANYNYFAEQGRRAGYMGPEIGRSPYQHFGYHPQPHPYLFPPPHSHDMHEAIQRQIEKEQIREEIIMSEIMRRRVLEAEVRRELMMERELPRPYLLPVHEAVPKEIEKERIREEMIVSEITRRRVLEAEVRRELMMMSPVMGFDSATRLPLLGTRAEGWSMDERTVLSQTDREKLNGGYDTLPFQRGSADLRVLEVKPVPQEGKEKDKIILLAKPDENISGSKWNAATPAPGVDASEFPSDVILKKKANIKEEWSCALCRVSASSEQDLNAHLQGKKHKSKEAELRGQKTGKKFSIGLFPKKAPKYITVQRTIDPGKEHGVKLTSESLSLEKSEESSSKRDDPPLLQKNVNLDNLKKKQWVIVQKAQKNGNPKKESFRYWCDMCQVGICTEYDMNIHKKGTKHVSRLGKINENGGAGPSDQKKIAEEGKNIASLDDKLRQLEENKMCCSSYKCSQVERS